MYTIIRPKTRDEWLDIRKGGIGSSEVGTILGLNPFETPYQLWRRKLGMDQPIEENFAMKAGHYLEDAVSLFFRDETNASIIKSSAGDWIMRDNDRPYLQVSPDRTFWREGDRHNEANKGILECKTTQRAIDADDIPSHWLCQVCYQIGVAGYEHGAIAWLTQGRTFGYKTIEHDPEFYAYMVDSIERFWTDNIIGGKEPAAINAADIILKYPKEFSGKAIEADEELFGTIGRLKEVNQILKEFKDEKDKLEESIKMMIADAESVIRGGATLATWKANKDSVKFNEKLFQQEHPDLYCQYQEKKPGARVLRIK